MATLIASVADIAALARTILEIVLLLLVGFRKGPARSTEGACTNRDQKKFALGPSCILPEARQRQYTYNTRVNTAVRTPKVENTICSTICRANFKSWPTKFVKSIPAIPSFGLTATSNS
jgi:hypothetical protein